MAEQLSSQANDGGSIPSMDALVDAETTKSVFGRVVMATVSRSVGEIRAGSNPAARTAGRAKSPAFPQWSSGLGYLAFTRKVRVQSPVAENRDVTVAFAPLAQLVEHRSDKAEGVGSKPTRCTWSYSLVG